MRAPRRTALVPGFIRRPHFATHAVCRGLERRFRRLLLYSLALHTNALTSVQATIRAP